MFNLRGLILDHALPKGLGLGDAFAPHSLGYRPFLDPAPVDAYWFWWLVPLILIVPVVYRTIKTDNLSHMPRRAMYLAMQISAFMIIAAVVLWGTLQIF